MVLMLPSCTVFSLTYASFCFIFIIEDFKQSVSPFTVPHYRVALARTFSYANFIAANSHPVTLLLHATAGTAKALRAFWNEAVSLTENA